MAVIDGAAILPTEHVQALREIAPELEDTWRKQQLWRTETEAWVSVLNDIKHPTNASKYWQCVREQGVFIDQLVHLGYDFRAKECEREALVASAEELDEQAAHADGPRQRRLRAEAAGKRVEAERAAYLLHEMRRAAKDRVREILMWSRIKAELDDGSFDTADCNAHQLESYREQFRREAELAMTAKASPAELRNAIGKHETTERHYANRKPLLHRVPTTLP
jgi:hypothetical protein